MVVKGVILVAGPAKGTRFRPLSLDTPKPLFPVGGKPIIGHLILSLSKYVDEVLILGFHPNEQLELFSTEMSKETGCPIRYLHEYKALGTAGGLFHFRDRILAGNTDSFFLMNGDVCGHFPLAAMLEMAHVHSSDTQPPLMTILTTEATRQQSLNYGCLVADKLSGRVLHYVEKPSTYVSTTINCGVYLFSTEVFQLLSHVYNDRLRKGHVDEADVMWIEKDVLPKAVADHNCLQLNTNQWWSQIKTAASAIYANRHYLELYSKENDYHDHHDHHNVIGNVFIHNTADIHPSALVTIEHYEIGPNVSIGAHVVVGAGTRIKESIVLDNSQIGCHALLLYTVVGRSTRVGDWSRVEGTPNDPNPNRPFAKMENLPLFNQEGKLNPSIAVLGSHVEVLAEKLVLNSIVLPHKQIGQCFKNEIIL